MDKEKVKLMKSLIVEYKRDLESNGEKLLLKVTKELFVKYPDLEWFRWKQYTPYFNDGDECVFSAGIDYPDLKLHSEEDYIEEGWSDKEEHQKLRDSVVETLQGFDEEDYKLIFGDHVSITVYKDKIEVEEYEHD